jgi:hypothetical protein
MTEDDSVPITRIPPELHNLMWADFPEDFEQDNTVQMLRNTHNGAEQAWKDTFIAHNRAMANPLNMPDMNTRQSHNYAQKRAKEVEKGFHAAIREGEAQIAALNAAMNRVPKMPAEGVALRIADRLAALSPDERVKRINEAMKNGETDTIGAALFFSDPWLSGLSPDRRELFRVQYREATYPELVQRKAAIEKALDIAVKGFNGYQRQLGKMYDTKKLEKAQKLAEAAEMALR